MTPYYVLGLYIERGVCGISWFGRRSRSWLHWHVGPWHVGWDVA